MPAHWKAALAAPLLLSAQADRPPPRPVWGNYSYVTQVQCDLGMGSGVWVGRNRFVSVEHVTGNVECTTKGEPIEVQHNGSGQDFSIAKTKSGSRSFASIDCGGIADGQWVYAVGYARGWPRQQVITLRGTNRASPDGMALLSGAQTAIAGMSGGPILTERGAVVATINAKNDWGFTFVRQLKDTILCSGNHEE